MSARPNIDPPVSLAPSSTATTRAIEYVAVKVGLNQSVRTVLSAERRPHGRGRVPVCRQGLMIAVGTANLLGRCADLR